MHEYAQDAMYYVRNHGRLDYFITVTCNTKWPEIAFELMEGQLPIDRHALKARVFKQKLIKLIAVSYTHLDVYKRQPRVYLAQQVSGWGPRLH